MITSLLGQALIDYINSDFDISVYWDTLNKNGITKERLLSYDRAIHSEPNFRSEQKEGMLRDLRNYMRSLKVCKTANVDKKGKGERLPIMLEMEYGFSPRRTWKSTYGAISSKK